MDSALWIISPCVGAVIGYVTNSIAVVMIFRPHQPRGLLGFRLHGLVPKRQADLAKKIGEVVGTHLVAHEDLVAVFERIDLRPMIEGLLEHALDKKVAELRKLPMVGAFLTEDRIADLRGGIVDSILAHREVIVDSLEAGLESNLDVAGIVEEKVAAFPTERLESLILEVSRRELRAIVVWGAILGAVIGVLQVVLVEIFG